MAGFVTIGVAGHVDHGKTSLVRCLTGVETDRLEEERRRGLSIEAGIAPVKLSVDAQVALVDVPGHTDFLKNTIRGLSRVDLAILVVASDDGVMPQTREHLEILQILKVKSGFVVLSKADLVDPETLELAEIEICDLVEGTFLEGRPTIPFSALDMRGLDEIRSTIETQALGVPGKDPHVPFRMWIDQAKSFAGFGTVVSGTISHGTLKLDDPVQLFPGTIQSRVRALETHHRRVQEAVAGQRVGVNLHRVHLDDIERGMLLANPGLHEPTYLLNVELQLLPGAVKPVKNRQRVKLYVGTAVTNAMVVNMEKDRLDPGERSLIQLRLMKPLAASPRDPFLITLLNEPAVIGGGVVLEIPREKFREVKAQVVLSYLKALEAEEISLFIDRYFERNLSRPVPIEEIARNTGLEPEELEKEVNRSVEQGALLPFQPSGYFPSRQFGVLKKETLQAVKQTMSMDPLRRHGLNPQEIRARMDNGVHEAVFQKMLGELCEEGRLLRTDGGYMARTFKAELSSKQQKIAQMLLKFAEASDIIPFSADTFWKVYDMRFVKDEIQRLLNYLYSERQLVQLNDGRFLSLRAVEEVKRRVRETILSKGSFSLADCKETLGYGRWVGVPVLEHMDEIGFTRRQGNERVLNDKGGKP